jgi:fatty acid desaturase
MINYGSINDPVFIKPARYNFFDRFWIRRIADERDLPFIYLTLKICFTVIPLAILLFLPIHGLFWWGIALTYFIVNLMFMSGPYTLMLHCTSHRPLFKNEYKSYNNIIPWVLGPFFGHSPGTYYSHHMGMHHAENNLEDDLSSTMKYQRDSITDFFKYFFSFFFGVIVSLTSYHHIRKRIKMRNKVLTGETFFIAICIALMFFNLPAVMVVFVTPLLLTRFIMMIGNWGQHSFVDFDEPGNCYKNSITCTNTPYNKICFNDGYHIDHHLKPTMHYTQYPEHFQNHIAEFSKNKALVFDNLHYLHIWFYLMTKNYAALAKHMVNINETFVNDAEAIALLKSRTAKMALRGINAKNYKSKILTT